MSIVLPWLLCLTLPVEPNWETNHVSNPSFEDDQNRDGTADGWQASAGQSPAKLAWDAAVAHTGTHSVRISDSYNPSGKTWQETAGRWALTRRFRAEPGKAYSLAAWIKTEGVTGRAQVCIAWFSQNKWLAENWTTSVSGTHDWQRVTVTGKAPADAVWGSVYLQLASSRGTAWFDDVDLCAGQRLQQRFDTVDLRGVGNAALQDLLQSGGKKSLGNTVVLRGVPFDLAADGGKCIVLGGQAGDSLRAVTAPVGRRCETLYFLHIGPEGKSSGPVGQYEIVLADGTTVAVPLRSGREVTTREAEKDTPESAVVWLPQGKDAAVARILPVRLKPDTDVRAVRVQTVGNGPALCLLAVTASDGPPVLCEKQIRYEFTDTTGWYPFTYPTDDTNRDTIDLSGLLDAPAGRHGFLTTRDDGHFYFRDGTRARFFGTNICSRSAFPEREQAVAQAERLAKYGVNLLRIHAVDSQWTPLIDTRDGNTRRLNPETLDRFDFFVAELKKRGIYIYLDLLDYRTFLPGDGVRDAAQFQHGWTNSIKGATIYNQRLIELQMEYATQLLTHLNPYTKLRYVDEPAVAVVEITNENSVFYFRNTKLTLPSYVDELAGMWNRWLIEQYGDRARLAKAWSDTQGNTSLNAQEDPAAGTVSLPLAKLYADPAKMKDADKKDVTRLGTMKRFLFDVERQYYTRMRAHLRKIGLQVPVTGTNQTFCAASNYADAANDFMSRNNYWCHPNVHAEPFFTYRNKAMVQSDLASTSNPITEVASSSVAGKPMIVPEFNFPWPIDYRAEGLLLMTAYACLQDWDGVLLFAYNSSGQKLEWFSSQSDPVRWGEFPAAALLFHRQDIAAAKRTVLIDYPTDKIFAAGASHAEQASSPYREVTYVSKIRNRYAPADPRPLPAASPAQKFASDTGQLSLDAARGLFTADTPKSKIVLGFLGQSGPIQLGEVRVQCDTAFAAVVVSSLDGRPIGQSRRLLVTAVARAENTGQAYTDNKRSVPQWGAEPVLNEPVRGRLSLPMPGAVEAHALDPTGKRMRSAPVAVQGGRCEVRLDELRSPWCELVSP